MITLRDLTAAKPPAKKSVGPRALAKQAYVLFEDPKHHAKDEQDPNQQQQDAEQEEQKPPTYHKVLDQYGYTKSKRTGNYKHKGTESVVRIKHKSWTHYKPDGSMAKGDNVNTLNQHLNRVHNTIRYVSGPVTHKMQAGGPGSGPRAMGNALRKHGYTLQNNYHPQDTEDTFNDDLRDEYGNSTLVTRDAHHQLVKWSHTATGGAVKNGDTYKSLIDHLNKFHK